MVTDTGTVYVIPQEPLSLVADAERLPAEDWEIMLATEELLEFAEVVTVVR